MTQVESYKFATFLCKEIGNTASSMWVNPVLLVSVLQDVVPILCSFQEYLKRPIKRDMLEKYKSKATKSCIWR